MNVLVTVGTGAFDELIAAIDNLNIKAVCQIGQGTYTPKNHQWFRMQQNLDALYQWADVIVTHAGGGTLFEVLPLGKKVIALANPERTDRHQEELLHELARQNVLLPCQTVRDLPKTITAAQHAKLAQYVAEPCAIPAVISAFLEEAA